MDQLRSRHLFDVSFTLHPVQNLGATPMGTRRIVPVSGGTFSGERVKGIALPVGTADWIIVRADGSVQLDVRVTLETDDGALIYMTYRGVRHSTPEVAERLVAGEAVDPSEYYFRTTPYFETSSEKYAWMNNIVSVAVGERLASAVKYRIYEIL